MLTFLIQMGARVDIPDSTGRTALMHTAECSFFEEAKTLLYHGADPNFANPITGLTALAYAISEGEYKMAEFLASKGVSINKAVDSIGVSTLRTIRTHIQVELDKKASQSAIVTTSDAVSVRSTDSEIQQVQKIWKPVSIGFLRRLIAAFKARSERLVADRHPLVALSPFIKAALRRKIAEIRHRKTGPPRPSLKARQVSFLPSKDAT